MAEDSFTPEETHPEADDRRKKTDQERADANAPVQPKADPTFLSRLYDLLSLGGIFILTLLLAAQVLPGLHWERMLWFPDEFRQADILRGLMDGDWFRLRLNGEFHPDSPPLYFWFLAALKQVLGLAYLTDMDKSPDYATLILWGAAVSGLLLLWSVFALASRAIRLNRQESLAAGCILLSALGPIFYRHSGQDLLFAALITLSLLFLCQGLPQERAHLRLGLGFVCSSLAMLTGGWLGLGLPLLSAVLFCLWLGRPLRFLKPDFLLSLLLSLLPVLLWLGYLWSSGDSGLVLDILEQARQKTAGHPKAHPWWYYLATMPLFWLPWSILPLLGLFSPFQGLKQARTKKNQGTAFAWIALLAGLILLSALSHKEDAALLILLGPLAALSGRSAVSLTPWKSTLLQRFFALFFLSLASLCVFLPVFFSGHLPGPLSRLAALPLPAWPVKLEGVFILLVLLLAGLTLCCIVKTRRPEGSILILTLILSASAYPMGRFILPSLDPLLGVKESTLEIRRHAESGYTPVTFGLPSGILAYYAGKNIPEVRNQGELQEFRSRHSKVLLVLPQDERQPQGFNEQKRFWVLNREYVLLLEKPVTEWRPPDLPTQRENARPIPEPATEIASEPNSEPHTETTLEPLSEPSAEILLEPLPEQNAELPPEPIMEQNAVESPEETPGQMPE